MNNMSFELTYYNSPFYVHLIQQLVEISRKKISILNKIRTGDDLEEKLQYDEREMLKHFSERENQILLQIIEYKGWFAKTGS